MKQSCSDSIPEPLDLGLSLEDYETLQNLYVDICNLIVESRIPGINDRGYGDGPHCPPILGHSSHICDSTKPECQKHQRLILHLMRAMRRKVLEIEVLMIPDCCSESKINDRIQKNEYVLLERWSMKCISESVQMPIDVPQLQRAVRSFLHFSQISAWLSASKGKDPSNICYWIKPTESCGTQFDKEPEEHSFPIFKMDEELFAEVKVEYLPRSQYIPVIPCSKHPPRRAVVRTLSTDPIICMNNPLESSSIKQSRESNALTNLNLESREINPASKHPDASKSNKAFKNPNTKMTAVLDSVSNMPQNVTVAVIPKSQNAYLLENLRLGKRQLSLHLNKSENQRNKLFTDNLAHSVAYNPLESLSDIQCNTLAYSVECPGIPSEFQSLPPQDILMPGIGILEEDSTLNSDLQEKMDTVPDMLLELQRKREVKSIRKKNILNRLKTSYNPFHTQFPADTKEVLNYLSLETTSHSSKEKIKNFYPKGLKNSTKSELVCGMGRKSNFLSQFGSLQESPPNRNFYFARKSTKSSFSNINTPNVFDKKYSTRFDAETYLANLNSILQDRNSDVFENSSTMDLNDVSTFDISTSNNRSRCVKSKFLRASNVLRNNAEISDLAEVVIKENHFNSSKRQSAISKNLVNIEACSNSKRKHKSNTRSAKRFVPNDFWHSEMYKQRNENIIFESQMDICDHVVLDNVPKVLEVLQNNLEIQGEDSGYSKTTYSNVIVSDVTGEEIVETVTAQNCDILSTSSKRNLMQESDSLSRKEIKIEDDIKRSRCRSYVNNFCTQIRYDTFLPRVDASRKNKAKFPIGRKLLGNFEESILKGHFPLLNTVEGFYVEIGANGNFCPRHVTLPADVSFYELETLHQGSAPYMAHITLEDKEYYLPKKGSVQVTLFNPSETVVKVFVLNYDLSDMPPLCHTFIRQKTFSLPVGSLEEVPSSPKWLRFIMHLKFASSKTGKIFLHNDFKIVVLNKSNEDAACEFSEQPRELRSFLSVPKNPTFSPI